MTDTYNLTKRLMELVDSEDPNASLIMEAVVEIDRLLGVKKYMRDWRDEWAKRHNTERHLADAFSEYATHSSSCPGNGSCTCGLTDLVEQWERLRS